MRCPECGGNTTKHVGEIQWLDRLVGPLCIADGEYWECLQCRSRIYPPDTAGRMGDVRNVRIRDLLLSRPVGEFVSTSEARSALGMSRQAFHKNRRIRRGFIYRVEMGKHFLYHRSSVTRYQAEGDGRFPLWPVSYGEAQRETAVSSEFVTTEGIARSGIEWNDIREARVWSTPMEEAYAV